MEEKVISSTNEKIDHENKLKSTKYVRKDVLFAHIS
jgi:hypothetical protein